MEKNQKMYSDEFKKQVAMEAIENKLTVEEIATKNNVSPSMVSTWKKAFIDGDFNKELIATRKELDEAKRKLEETTLALSKMRLEIELAKKKLSDLE